MYLSYQTMHEKPSADAYQTLLTDLGLKRIETVFIDDQLKNVQAAQELGTHAIHFYGTSTQRAKRLRDYQRI